MSIAYPQVPAVIGTFKYLKQRHFISSTKPFDFEDDHEHAFFMDNKYWSGYAAFFSSKMRGDERLTKSYKLERLNLSKGDPFKYVFDFGNEWRFQCKILRELEEQTDIPGVIRRVGIILLFRDTLSHPLGTLQLHPEFIL